MSSSSTPVTFENPRKVVKKVLSLSQSEGDGATVRRSIGGCELRNLDPFLLLDEFSVSKPAGFPDHPHRGFETVTYMLDVRTHALSFFHVFSQIYSASIVLPARCLLKCCSVFYVLTMHAGGLHPPGLLGAQGHHQDRRCPGRGIVHSEMPAADGVQKGLQLWINLASKDKMIEPRYQELKSKDISQAEKHGVKVRIIAGEAFGVQSPVYTRTPTMYMDFTMQPGSQLHQPIPEGWNAFVYIIEGEGVFGGEGDAPASTHHCLVLGAGNGLSVWKRSGAQLRFVLAAGQPLNEPVVQQGLFVMNSRAQIQQAMQDYYYGRNGFEKASQWSSA
ncbi:hypothetical protein CFC21_054129 [Triticum aestivum]|uniref:Pirin C-terminal domain-containing protein n=2 Tax=Triticum aestivum TaxID=4565 RepID=A0A9R1GCB5_WHEAT|nr:pirin-like protein isoform X1 [Triticum aestivum]KAF7044973.1 hypothetical protein CFC21_054127 [Triticum aestivum]KAF7044976.1 hypothetical protein CFC21_054129 [Triticum aestivum]